MGSKSTDYISLAIAELEKCGGHGEEEVEHALEVLEDLVTYGELPATVVERIDDIQCRAFNRTRDSERAQYAARSLTSVNGLCYQKEDLSLACSQYLFDAEHEIVDPPFSVDTSKQQSEESSHKRWQCWHEFSLFSQY